MNRKLLLLSLCFLIVFAPVAAYAAPFYYPYNSTGNGTVVTPHHNYAIRNPYYQNLARLNTYNAYISNGYRAAQKVYTLNGFMFTKYRDYIVYYNYLYTHPELYDCEACPDCPGCTDEVAIPQGAVPINNARLRYIYR